MTRSHNVPILLLLLMILQACGIARTTTDRSSSSSVPDSRVLEAGVASWYGPKFHGKLTANGETYDMNGLTAAHRTLPFNTVVTVVNQSNGREVTVRINDRGPYIDNRVIDLSRKAAQEVDMIDSGTAPVQIFFVKEGDRPITDQNRASRETFTVQLASYDRMEQAERRSREIKGSRVERVQIGDRVIYRVYYGVYTSTAQARSGLREIERRGLEGFVKQIEN